MREVFTVSLGGHANFVNTHFWNFQVLMLPCCLAVLGVILVLLLVAPVATPPLLFCWCCHCHCHCASASSGSVMGRTQDELAATQAGELGEVDHDVLFRTGENASGTATYTPRLVAVDAKGGLGGLPQHGKQAASCGF